MFRKFIYALRRNVNKQLCGQKSIKQKLAYFSEMFLKYFSVVKAINAAHPYATLPIFIPNNKTNINVSSEKTLVKQHVIKNMIFAR